MRPLPEKRSRRHCDLPQHLANNRLKNGFDHMTTRSQSQKKTKSPKRAAKRSRESKNELNGLLRKEPTSAEKRADRANKRRSALWVLNCEAESFLFGETAAEKHEVELPPISPPKKRSRFKSHLKRRMRTNELETLLNETPLLGWKLRKDSPNSSDSAKSPIASSLPHPNPPILNGDESWLSTPLSSPDSNAQSVHIQKVLCSMEWRFSFEDIPNDEAWYRTFSRQNSPRLFQVHRSSTLLPYEAKANRRGLSKLSKLPRKSPRCHASTLAILSSHKPSRTKNSVAASPPAQVGRPRGTSSTSPSPSQPSPSRANSNSLDMTATQYLWDSIHLLSDPYVVQVLALERAGGRLGKGVVKNNHHNNNYEGNNRVGRKSPRKSPVVLVSDIFRNKRYSDEMLFAPTNKDHLPVLF